MRIRHALILAAVLGLLGLEPRAAQAQQDPYGPRAGQPDPYGPRAQAPRRARDLSRVTPLLAVEDGTPRYQRVPEGMSSPSDAISSQMLAFSLEDNMPVNGGRSSAVTTGEHGGLPVTWDYIVRFWEEWPNAKDRPGREERLGEIVFTTEHGSNRAPPPPAVKRVLDAQADRLRDAILAYPFIRRSDRVMTRTLIRYHRDKDPSGTEVWGYSLNIQFGPETLRPEQLPDGRWRWTSFDWMSLEICSNCFEKLRAPTGRYRDLQTMSHLLLVDTLAAPVWVSEFRSGEGDPIPNPELYDRSRPDTDIQILTVKPPHGIGAAGMEGPDNHHARAVAATWLTDWKTLVDQANGPAAPRAD